MTPFPQLLLDVHPELICDLFAGAGGASLGIEMATGRQVDIAINHDAACVALHKANHPQTTHHVVDVFEADPRVVTQGRPIGLLWASPDCTDHSKAKGGKPIRTRLLRDRPGSGRTPAHEDRAGPHGGEQRLPPGRVRACAIVRANVPELIARDEVLVRDWTPLGRARTKCPRCGADLKQGSHPIEMREPTPRRTHVGNP